MPDNHITMKDIARELNISVATVSRALANSPSISMERREAIQRYAAEHNFTPNVMAKNLRNTRVRPTKTIGVIVPQLVHYYFSTVLSGIIEEARRGGYQVIVGQSHESFERERDLCQSFLESRVCGIVVSLAKETQSYAHFRELQDRGLPLVFFDRICHGINASRVVVDDYQGSYNAVSYLIRTGCRRIAFYGSPMHMEISKNRHNGYKDALLRNGIAIDESIVFLCDSRREALRITPEVLTRPDRPDAFFCVNDDTAIGVIQAARYARLRVPEDISVFGFSYGIRANSCDPLLSSVDQRGEEVGREAVHILISEVEGIMPMRRVNKSVVKTELVIQGSTRAIK